MLLLIKGVREASGVINYQLNHVQVLQLLSVADTAQPSDIPPHLTATKLTLIALSRQTE